MWTENPSHASERRELMGLFLAAETPQLWTSRRCLQEPGEHRFDLSVWRLHSSEPIGFFINHPDHNGCMDREFKRADLPCHSGLCEEHGSFFFFFPLPYFSSGHLIHQPNCTTIETSNWKKKKKCNDTWVNDWALLNPQGIRLTIPFDLKNQSASC